MILAKYGLTAQLRVLKPGQTTAVSVRRAMEEIGVTSVKLGQLLSTRSDLLPAEFINELSKLTIEADPQEYRLSARYWRTNSALKLDSWLQIDPEPQLPPRWRRCTTRSWTRSIRWW